MQYLDTLIRFGKAQPNKWYNEKFFCDIYKKYKPTFIAILNLVKKQTEKTYLTTNNILVNF